MHSFAETRPALSAAPGEHCGGVPGSTSARLILRIRAEFEECLGISVTVEEGARFWGLDRETCAQVLAALVASGFLCRTADGRYRKRPSV